MYFTLHFKRLARRFLTGHRPAALALLLGFACGVASAQGISPAFYYGPMPFPQALRVFNTWIVEPDQIQDARAIAQHQDKIFAYAALGEVLPSRSYFKKMPEAWLKGKNVVWGSRVIDQNALGWPAFFVDEIITPLWQQGYRGFFLDTLDSYHLIAATPEARQAQEVGMIAAIRLLKQRYPGARLILNRGFEILPEVAPLVHAVAAESLFGGWDNSKKGGKRYTQVSANDRDWLKTALLKVRDSTGLPVIVIDYAKPDRAVRRDLANKIRAEGFIPYVSDGDLAGVGTGIVEPMPRTLLMLYDGNPDRDDLKLNYLHTQAAMPLNYLGYVPEYRNINGPLPSGDLSGRYAGIVTWLARNDARPAYRKWLLEQIAQGIPVAVLNSFGFNLDPVSAKQLGLTAGARVAPGKIGVLMRKPEAAFETEPHPDAEVFSPLAADRSADVWLKLGDGRVTQDAVAITAWGGYAIGQATVHLPGSDFSRWVVDPFAFLTRALRLPAMPAPDVTTENGRRLLITHIDGDGFASRAEFPGSPWAAEVLIHEILARYRVPTTLSIIEGETGKAGLYPHYSADLEAIARRMFALPHVEAASHSYSHPFFWQKAGQATADEASYHLDIPGYAFNNAREFEGSVKYVDSLLPSGKRTQVFLWSGDCNPSVDQVAHLSRLGLLNMNGGETLISRSQPTLTSVAPLGIPRGEFFQVYAPMQNENLYTNEWTGPFYGYERVIETFELTETPRRLKPVNIYYHTYSASKPASLKALKKVYDWAMQQPLLPIYASDYIRKVNDFNSLAIAREGDAWRIVGGDAVRTLRIPVGMGYPDLARSENVLGWRDEGAQRYLHLGGGATSLLVMDGQASQPRLERANARITPAEKGWRFAGSAPLDAEFAGAARCTFRIDNRPAAVRALSGGRIRLTHPAHNGTLEMYCGQ